MPIEITASRQMDCPSDKNDSNDLGMLGIYMMIPFWTRCCQIWTSGVSYVPWMRYHLQWPCPQSLLPAKELVVWDLIILTTGNSVPADVRIIDGVEISIDESSLTDENSPVNKMEMALTVLVGAVILFVLVEMVHLVMERGVSRIDRHHWRNRRISCSWEHSSCLAEVED